MGHGWSGEYMPFKIEPEEWGEGRCERRVSTQHEKEKNRLCVK